MLAERLPDAAPLPWLKSGQEHAIGGTWLLMLGLREPQAASASLRGAWLYMALPVGNDSDPHPA